MAARITQVCEAVCQALRERFGLTDAEVGRDYLPDPSAGEDRPSGKRVYVFPLSAEQAETATRREDAWDYEVGVAVAEFYAGDGGDPPTAWADERIDLVDGFLRVLADARADRLLRGLFPQRAAVPLWYDPDELRESKRFVAELRFVFRAVERG